MIFITVIITSFILAERIQNLTSHNDDFKGRLALHQRVFQPGLLFTSNPPISNCMGLNSAHR